MKSLSTLIIFLFALIAQAQLQSPRVSPVSEVKQTIGLSEVTVTYSRPAVRDRAIMGALVPFAERWRTGANENTTIRFSDPVKFGDQILPAGTYALYTKPGKSEWKMFFYKDASNWGMPSKWDASQVALSLAVPSKNHSFVESFTIAFEEVTLSEAFLTLSWENTKIRVPFSVPTNEKMQSEIDQVLAGTPTARDYYTAAVFHLNQNLDLQNAKLWIEKAVDMRSDAFWFFRQKSLIHDKLGERKAAIDAAKTSLELAEKAANQNYIRINKKQLREWGAL